MRRKELFDRAQAGLTEIYSPEEARAIALALFEEYLQLKPEDIFLDPDVTLDPVPAFSDALKKMEEGCPLQYVLGAAEFFGLRFRVDENVLIPRPETEELVSWVADEWRNKSVKILDIGTGSGAIAVSLAKTLPAARVMAVDISTGALNVARENAGLNGVKVDFMPMDILTEIPQETFDVIISNPPYVRYMEKAAMRKNVLDHEPATALFVPDSDPLLFYRRIAEIGMGILNDGGMLYYEINEAFGPETVDLMRSIGYQNVDLRKDFFDRDRMVRGVRKALF